MFSSYLNVNGTLSPASTSPGLIKLIPTSYLCYAKSFLPLSFTPMIGKCAVENALNYMETQFKEGNRPGPFLFSDDLGGMCVVVLSVIELNTALSSVPHQSSP